MTEPYKAKILEAIPCAAESEDSIVDAFIKLEINGVRIWAFVPNWRRLFPYPSMKIPTHRLGYGRKLLDNLLNRYANVGLKFLNLKSGKNQLKEKRANWIDERTVHFEIFGQVIEKKPAAEHGGAPPREILWVDCGVVVETDAKKGEFQAGDWIHLIGRLDAELIEVL
ncbi:hypothetical protein J4220_02125 [Candidatus Micrarchaeota archaeon]|nr:hypothetical protein [Candidatus Micrarchaeota archaeon]